MGMFDDLTGKAEEMLGKSGGQNSGLLKGVMAMLQDKQTGGLNGLIESFKQKGLGNLISSWVGTGENAPISPDQVKEGMGSERLEKVAAQAGMSSDEAASKLSEHLPNVVDKLTPEGKVPEGGLLDKGLEMLKGKFSR
jgi:uncharacterized protein YidB (DUF937 family)